MNNQFLLNNSLYRNSLYHNSLYEEIYKHGTYYNPASKHYGTGGNVACDRCHQANLDICIGYQDRDLCISCVQKINEEDKINKIQAHRLSEIAPYGYDSSGRIRTHWCTTAERSRQSKNRNDHTSELDAYFKSTLHPVKVSQYTG